jgi:hypothetical protein
MKKTKILVATIIAMAINFGSVFASENAKTTTPEKLLADQVTKVFYSVPMTDLIVKKSDLITVHFKVTPDHQFELLKVTGDNQELIRYSTLAIKNRKFKIDPSVAVKSYELPVRFIN